MFTGCKRPSHERPCSNNNSDYSTSSNTMGHHSPCNMGSLPSPHFPSPPRNSTIASPSRTRALRNAQERKDGPWTNLTRTLQEANVSTPSILVQKPETHVYPTNHRFTSQHRYAARNRLYPHAHASLGRLRSSLRKRTRPFGAVGLKSPPRSEITRPSPQCHFDRLGLCFPERYVMYP